VLTGLAVALLVLLVGWAFLQQRPTEYRAATTLVVLPDNANAEAASYYDTLSQGQIATTFAQILDLQATPPAAAAGSDPATISVDVLPDTSLIQVTATATDAATAETAADATLTQVRPYFDQLGWPYEVSVVEPAAGTAERTGFSSSILFGALAVVALVAAIAAYLAVRTLQQTRAARPAPRSAARPRRVVDRPAVPGSAAPVDRAEAVTPLDRGAEDETPTADASAGHSSVSSPLGGSLSHAVKASNPTTSPIGSNPVAGTNGNPTVNGTNGTPTVNGTNGSPAASGTNGSSAANASNASNGSHPAADPQPAR
jgi:hypothetical protein